MLNRKKAWSSEDSRGHQAEKDFAALSKMFSDPQGTLVQLFQRVDANSHLLDQSRSSFINSVATAIGEATYVKTSDPSKGAARIALVLDKAASLLKSASSTKSISNHVIETLISDNDEDISEELGFVPDLSDVASTSQKVVQEFVAEFFSKMEEAGVSEDIQGMPDWEVGAELYHAAHSGLGFYSKPRLREIAESLPSLVYSTEPQDAELLIRRR